MIQRSFFLEGAGLGVRRLDVTGPKAQYVKDCLKPGTWHHPAWSAPWDVTADTLNSIVHHTKRALQAGNKLPVVWDHSSSSRDVIGDIEDVEIRDGQLFAKLSIDADKSVRESAEVSVEVRENWMDGAGNTYPMCLAHVAVVQHPVIPGQGPFVRLSLVAPSVKQPEPSNGGSEMKKRYASRRLSTGKLYVRQLAEGETAAPDETVSEAAPPADSGSYESIPDTAADQIVTLLAKWPGNPIVLPDGTNGANLIERLTVVSSTLSQMEGDKASVDAGASADTVDAIPVDAMSGEAKSLAIGIYRRERQASKADLTKQLQTAFTTKLDGLLKDGHIVAATRDGLVKAGEANGWTLSLLQGFESKKVNTKSVTKQLAGQGDAGESGEAMTNADYRQLGLRAAGFGGKSREKAGTK